MIWDVQKDAFLLKIKPKELADTRWKVISLTASIFDPIGFLAPFIVWANVFLQSLWKLRQRWYEKIPKEIQQEWSVWQKELQSLAEFSAAALSPCYGVIGKEHDYEVSSTYYWSDSSAVIGQIRGESKRHPAFTANRLSKILDTSESQQ